MARKTVTHPNPRISQEDALASLYDHPTFPEGGRVASIKRVKGRWEAVIDFTKQAAPPAFADDEAPTDEPKGPPLPKPKDEESESKPKDEGSDDESSESPLEEALEGPDEDKEEGEGGDSLEKAVHQLTSLVTQIAEAVGVHPHLGDEGPEGDLGPGGPPPGKGAPPGAGGPPPGKGAPPAGPAGPAGKPPVKPPLRPGMAPPGATPVGAPSFASVPHPLVGKVRSFVVSNVTDDSLENCKKQIDAKFGPHGYTVKQMVETTDESGARKVRAKISA